MEKWLIEAALKLHLIFFCKSYSAAMKKLALKRDFEKLHKYSIEKEVAFCKNKKNCPELLLRTMFSL